MRPPSKPPNEAARLAALRRYDLLDTPPEQALDDLVALAAQICGAPVSLISLVDQDRQWFKSRIGMSASETPRDISFCGHAILEPDLFIVADAATDPRFVDNPLVLEDPKVRFYASASLRTPTGEALGTLCVMDRVPRELSQAQQDALRILGRQVMAQLELRRQGRLLAESHEQLFAVFRNCPFGVTVHRWYDGTFIDANAAFSNITGWSRDQVVGRTATDLAIVSPEAAAAIRDRISAGERIEGIDFEIRCSNGEIRHVLFGIARLDLEGESLAINTFVDITDRQRAEAALRDSEERLRMALDSARMGTFDWDARSDRWIASPGFFTMLGYPVETGLSGRAIWLQRIHPDDQTRVAGLIRGVLEQGVPVVEYEFRIRHADGSWRWVEMVGRVLSRGPDGRPSRVVGVRMDITDRKLADAALRNSEERLRMALESARMGTFDWDVRAGSWQASPTYYTMLGYPPESGLVDRMVWFNRIHPEDRERVAGLVRALLNGSTASLEYEARIRHADGSWRWAELVGHVLSTDEHGKPTRVVGVRMDITDRKLADAALREREQLLQEAQRVGQVGSWVHDIDGERTQWSSELYHILGVDPDQSVPSLQSLLALIHPDDRVWAQISIDRAMHTGMSFNFEARIVRPDATTRIVQWRGQVERKPSGKPSRLMAVCQDLTERKATEQARLASEARYSTLFANAPDGLVIADGDSYYIDANASMCRMLGYTHDEFVGLHARDIVTPLEVSHIEPALTAIKSSSDYHREWMFRRKDGTTFPAEVIATTMPDGNLLGMIRDITERRQAEQRIDHLNRMYAVLSHINQAIVRERDPQAILNAACRIAVEQGQFKMAWIGLMPPGGGPLRVSAHAGGDEATMAMIASMQGNEDREGICDFTRHALTTCSHAVCNDILNDPAASCWREPALERGYHAMASLCLKQGPRIIGVFNLYAGEAGSFTDDEMRLLDELAADIAFALEMLEREAQRHVVEGALRDSEARFRQLADNIREVFWMTDPETHTMLYVSPAYASIWGRPCEELYGRPKAWLPAIHPDDRARVDTAESGRTRVEDYDETYRIVRPDGTIRWIHDRAFPVIDAQGRLIRIVGTAEDITDRRELEGQLRQSQKMDAIGQLAGGVAHDFNNLLTVIQGFGSLLTMGDQSSEETAESASQIVQAAEKAASLTRQLLAFSRRQVLTPKLVDLNDLITGVAKMLQRIVGEDVSLVLEPCSRAVVTHADPGLMDQVLMNLVVNARDAMPDGGRITIETGEQLLSERDARSIPGATPGRHVWVSVRDTGSGIAPADLPRIFEPFFTTKDPGKGTGLGLATVFGIVAQHQGAVQVESGLGSGTLFRIYLPAAAVGESADGPTAQKPRPRGGNETVLLVEDEASVRQLTRVVLQHEGYTVVEATHGAEALRLWESQKDGIDLVLTDIVMPEGMSGRELVTRLRAQSPKLRVIFTSGYSREIAGREMSLEEGRDFVQKPFMPDELLTTVRRCLDG